MSGADALLTRLEQAKQSGDVWEIHLAEQALEHAAPKLAAEVIRLQDDFNTALADAKDSHKLWADCKEKLTDAEAENARLREGLDDLLGDAEKVIKVLAEIRQVTGLGDKPMLSDLAGEIGKILVAKEAENKRLRDLLTKAESEQCASCRHCDSFGFRAALKGGEI
ncbi:MAG: hypothetical protein ING71_17400 [Rhodocyclaceae bacterium]|nr:hypothetical protein [Rhodocyclaceae bacterium]